MKRNFLVALMLLMLALSFTLGIGQRGIAVPPIEATGSSLRSLAQKHGIYIGPAVGVRQLRKDPNYRDLLAREFNMLVPENDMKFEPLHPERYTYDFEKADTLVSFALANDMKVRSQTLTWYHSLPRWLVEGNFSRDELIEILRDHIQTVVGRYRGQISAWDVVNEAVNADGSLRDTIWLRGIGPEYIDLAFRWAHEADPQAGLFLNDYAHYELNQKSDAIYELVKGMVQRGVPINGVGYQMHVGLWGIPKTEKVAASLKRYAELGIDVHFTEFEVSIKSLKGSKEKKFAQQAQLYSDLMRVCLAAKNCKAFVMWGFTDRYSWLANFTGYPDAPLIFDRFYRPKPAYNALKKVMSSES